jgi:hypothetical protein
MNIDVSLEVPKRIAQGLLSGNYERVGGVVREMGSKQVVAWLRDGYKASNQVLSNVLPLSPLNASASAALTLANPIISVLNLAVSTMGFLIINKRLGVIEDQLEQAQGVLQNIDYKIDLSFYANFRAALDLACNAFTMSNSETRKMSAMQAINRFLEAEHHYTTLADIEISNGSLVADEYLSTLCLAFITEVRCYLELEELDTAQRRMQEGVAVLRPRFEKHVNTLLTSNPAAYLHPSLKEQVGLKHLTKVYQWLEPGLDESDVFEMQRENLFDLAQKSEEWKNSLPQAICIPKDSINSKTFNRIANFSKKFVNALPVMSTKSGSKTGSQEAEKQSPESEIFGLLPPAMSVMESMIEDYNRLAMYESELEIVHRLGMSFQEWQQLAPPTTAQSDGSELMYITVS